MSELKRQEPLVDEATVLEYLARYPEFFQRHAAMLDRIRIPHERKGTVSLVERQLDDSASASNSWSRRSPS